MWLLRGPFDLKDENALDQKFKLLKTGIVYTLTRDEHAPAGHLKLKSKQVSKDHAKYKVGQYSPDDVTRLDIDPTLKLSNSREVKPLTIRRGSETLEVHSTADTALQSGDVLVIGSGRKTITAQWHPLILFWRPSTKEIAPATKICASIGMKLTMSFVDSITHYVTNTLDLSDACLSSLLVGASLVTKAWVDRVFELAQLPPESGGLDDTFLLPESSNYTPNFSEEDAEWAQRKFWTEDSTRETIFNGLRFLIVTDGPLNEQFGMNIAKCGGTYDAYNVRNGLDNWEKSLSSNMKRAGKAPGAFHSALVVVLDEDDIKPALTREWDDLLTVLRNAESTYVGFKTVRIAILDKKVKVLDCYRQLNIESQFIPGTLAEEPSQLALSAEGSQPSRRRATRRGTTPSESQTGSQSIEADHSRRGIKRSRAELTDPPDDERATKKVTRRTRGTSAALEPAPEEPRRTSKQTRGASVVPEPAAISAVQPEQSMEDEEDLFAPPTRPLRARRARQGLGIIPSLEDDTSLLPDSTQPGPSNAPVPAVASEKESVKPVSSSMRRAVTRAQSRAGGFSLKIGDDDDDDDDTDYAAATQKSNDAPLEKFRALFDGTEDPSSVGADLSFAEMSQSRFGGSKAGPTATQLPAVMELDEDETQVSAELPLSSRTTVTSNLSGTSTKRLREDDNDGVPDSSLRQIKKRKGSQPPEASRVSSTLPTKVKGDKTGAVGGVLSAPDKNEHVLKALASMKRGKRNEDDFDREFNALRISKPQSEQERREEEEEDFFAHFDFAEQLRGKKCIEVREYVLPERAEAHHMDTIRMDGRGPLGTWRPLWEGKPNFKKFKKVSTGSADSQARNRGSRVELICPEEKDFGMGDAYWSHQGNSQSHIDDTSARTQQFRLPDFDISDSEEAAPRPTKTRGGRAATTTKKAAPKKATPLFIDDDDDNDDTPTMDVDDSAPSTLASSMTQSGRGRTNTRSKPTVIAVDSDSDDGIAFKSFKKKATDRR